VERSDPTTIGEFIADSTSSAEIDDPISLAIMGEHRTARREGREPREEDVFAEFPAPRVAEWRERDKGMEEDRQNRLKEEKEAKKKQRIERTLGAAQIPPIFHQSFDELDQAHNPAAFTACKELADSGSYEGKRGLILSGDSGNGKTTLATATIQRYIQRTKGMYRVKFWPINQWLQKIQDSFSEPGSEKVKDLYEYDFLVLDDLGKRRLTTWPAEVLFSVVDNLYSHDRMLIVTTNWTAEEMIKELDYSLASRITGMCHEIILEPHDYRQKPRLCSAYLYRHLEQRLVAYPN